MTANPARLLFLSLALLLPLRTSGAEYSRPDGEGENNPSGLGLSYVTYVTGDALFRSSDTEEWEALTPNLSLRAGDRLWSGDGAKIEIRLPDAATAWLSYESGLDLVRLERGRRGDTIPLALASGEASFDVRRFRGADSVLQVDLPAASVRAFDEARFRLNALPDNAAQLGVSSGSVELETPDGVTTVREGQFAELRPDGRVTIDFLPPVDDWDDWVQERADRYDRPAASARYLPPDLFAYAPEFDYSGRWMAYAPYGYVWVPRVAPDWSPYSNGRWVWEAGDYVWLSFDPWYAPFHFGRWNFVASLGWFWVAPRTAHWSPGYVAWSLTDDGVCWVPLGHGEVYYGYGNYGPNTVNVYRTTRINVTNVYINSRVRNGVVVVRRDDFLRGRVVRDRGAEPRNPFVRRGRGSPPILGRPPVRELTPTRETRVPRPEPDAVRRSRPPERVERESDVVRRRSAVRERDKSVFGPGRAPQRLRNVEREPGVDEARPPRRRPDIETRERKAPERTPAPGVRERKPPEQRTQPGARERKAPEPTPAPGVRERKPPEPQPRLVPEQRRPGGPRPEEETPPAEPRERGPAAPELGVAPAPPPAQAPPSVGRRPFRRAPEPPEGAAPTTPRFEDPRGRQAEPPRERQDEGGNNRGRPRDGSRGR